jgi:RHS repeat-associated protein
MNDKQRIALVRSGDAHPDDRGPAVAFQLADHLGSAAATLDGSGTLTNREEYTPYGETSFGSYTRKRYRFTGRERDEESGLAHHCARYYAPWRCRWSSADPLGPAGGMNLFGCAIGNPIRLTDTTGRQTRGRSPIPTPSSATRTWSTRAPTPETSARSGKATSVNSVGKPPARSPTP